MRTGLNITAYTMFRITSDPERSLRARKFVTEGLNAGALKPIIGKTFKLDQIVEAHRYMESNEQIGKIVVTV
jgi:NADPH:quinone reductase-like Zn-dependent oxidoreductase